MENVVNIQEIAFELIAKAGDARSTAFEALNFSKKNEFDNAKEKLSEANKLFGEAHHIQFSLLSQEAQGTKNMEITFLMVHAQDHLMTAMLAKDLIQEMILMNEKNNELKVQLANN